MKSFRDLPFSAPRFPQHHREGEGPRGRCFGMVKTALLVAWAEPGAPGSEPPWTSRCRLRVPSPAQGLVAALCNTEKRAFYFTIWNPITNIYSGDRVTKQIYLSQRCVCACAHAYVQSLPVHWYPGVSRLPAWLPHSSLMSLKGWSHPTQHCSCSSILSSPALPALWGLSVLPPDTSSSSCYFLLILGLHASAHSHHQPDCFSITARLSSTVSLPLEAQPGEQSLTWTWFLAKILLQPESSRELGERWRQKLQTAQWPGGRWRLGAGGPVDNGVYSAMVGRCGCTGLLSAGLLEGVMGWEERVRDSMADATSVFIRMWSSHSWRPCWLLHDTTLHSVRLRDTSSASLWLSLSSGFAILTLSLVASADS